MHIVLIRFSSLGDIILQSPILGWLKSHYPKCTITFITSQEFSSLVKGHPYIDNVHTIERKKGMDDIKQLKLVANYISNELGPDLIIDLHNTLRAKIIRLFCFKIPAIVVDKRSFLRTLLIRFKLDFLKKLESHHERIINDFKFIFKKDFDSNKVIQFNSEQTQNNKIGLTTIPKSFVNESVKEGLKQEFSKFMDEEFIAISPIASFAPKRWPMDYVTSLIHLILEDNNLNKLKIIIVAGPNDTYCDEINSEFINSSGRVENLQGKTTLEETGLILAKAKVCISNDTGTGHITEAFGNPVLSIFGPTTESFGFRSHLELSKSLSVSEWCRPCSGTGKKECMRKEQYCMINLKPEFVYNELLEVLDELNKRKSEMK
jgi:heptosyltransferase-2